MSSVLGCGKELAPSRGKETMAGAWTKRTKILVAVLVSKHRGKYLQITKLLLHFFHIALGNKDQ